MEMVSHDFSSGNVLYHLLCAGPVTYLYDVTEFLEITHMCNLKHVCLQACCLHLWVVELCTLILSENDLLPVCTLLQGKNKAEQGASLSRKPTGGRTWQAATDTRLWLTESSWGDQTPLKYVYVAWSKSAKPVFPGVLWLVSNQGYKYKSFPPPQKKVKFLEM